MHLKPLCFSLFHYQVVQGMSATIVGESQCSSCKNQKRTYKCELRSQYFCSECLSKLEQELNSKFGQIEGDRNRILQIVTDQKKDPSKHSLMLKIDQWESDSKKIIEQKANECRKVLRNYGSQVFAELESQLNDIAKNLTSIREKNLFTETHVREFQEKLDDLSQEVHNSSAVSIETQSTSLVAGILVKYTKLGKHTAIDRK